MLERRNVQMLGMAAAGESPRLAIEWVRLSRSNTDPPWVERWGAVVESYWLQVELVDDPDQWQVIVECRVIRRGGSPERQRGRKRYASLDAAKAAARDVALPWAKNRWCPF